MRKDVGGIEPLRREEREDPKTKIVSHRGTGYTEKGNKMKIDHWKNTKILNR